MYYKIKKEEVMKKRRIVSIVIALLIVIFMLTACTPGNGPTAPPQKALSAFNTSCLPLAVTGSDGSYGSFTFDANGNLLFVVNDADEIRLLDRNTCTVTTVATGVSGNTLLGMTYYQDSIYVGDDYGNIYKVNPTNGSSTLLTTASGTINGLVIAPAIYGSYGGQLIVATYNGNIYAVDQSVTSPTPVLIANIGAIASALIFGSDGTLYVADHDNNKIVTVTAAGVVADFATGLSQPDGLAIGDSAGLLYVANSGDDTLKSVTIPGGSVSTITSVDFDDGWYPSPIIYDATSNILLMGSGEDSLTIVYYDGNI
jgi:hypothetical protein